MSRRSHVKRAKILRAINLGFSWSGSAAKPRQNQDCQGVKTWKNYPSKTQKCWLLSCAIRGGYHE